MQITVDIDSTDPLFAQLVEQIKKAVHKNQLKPGDPLPSIRQLANDLALNNKTVAKAYKLLERDSVIQTKGYRGTYVHPDAITNCTINLNDMVQAKINETIAACRSLGATDSEIRIAFSAAMQNQVNGGA